MFRAELMTDANLIDRRARAVRRCFARPRRRTRRTPASACALAAADAGALHAQSGADRGQICVPASSIWRWRRARSWTTTTAGKCGRPPTAIRRSRSASDLKTVADLGRRVWLNTKQDAPAPAASPHQAAAETRRPQAAQEGESSRANGPASSTATASVRIRPKTW